MTKKNTVVPEVVVPEEVKEVAIYEVRMYMKSGNMIELNNLVDFTIDITSSQKGMRWSFADWHTGFKLMSTGIDIEQIECVAFRIQN